MSVEDANKIKIIGKFSFSLDPKEWDLFRVNQLFISIMERESLEYFDLSSRLTPTLVMQFIQYQFAHYKPTNSEKILSYFSFKNSDPIQRAYERTITHILEEMPFKIIINFTRKQKNEVHIYDCEIEVLTILYQKVLQDFVSLNNPRYESKLPHILQYNTDLIKRIISNVHGTIIEEPHFTGFEVKMQIFISHSQNDDILKQFINQPFASSNVKAIFEEYEKLIEGKISIDKIKSDISQSNAIFVLLSENVNKTPYTRDWVAFESGYGSALKKDVWVIEPIGDRNTFSFITPGLTDYFPFTLGSEEFLKYFKLIIESYNYVFMSKQKLKGIKYECKTCLSIYNIHCPDKSFISKEIMKCPVCNEPIVEIQHLIN